MEQEKIRTQQQETGNINLADMKMKKQQHQTGKMNRTETNSIESMKTQQHDKEILNKNK